MKRLLIVVFAVAVFAVIWGASGALSGYRADYVNAQRGPR